jgi:hypothetical protein
MCSLFHNKSVGLKSVSSVGFPMRVYCMVIRVKAHKIGPNVLNYSTTRTMSQPPKEIR